MRTEGDSAGNGIAVKAILTVGGLVRATKAVVEENVFEGRSAGPRLVVHHAAQMIYTCMVGADGLTPFRRKFGTLAEFHGGEVTRILLQGVPSHRGAWWTFDGRFRMVRTIKRANADDRWKIVSAIDAS